MRRNGLGEVAIDANSPLVAWAQAVRNRGNQTSLMPVTSPLMGQLAEKVSPYNIPAGRTFLPPAVLYNGMWYVPAPAANQRIYAAMGQSYKDAIARNAFWEKVQPMALVKSGTSAAGTLAREAVSGITGIPSWAIPILLVAGGAYALHTVLGTVTSMRPLGSR